ncbi:MAG: uroporphyrinogen-III synthase [Nitrospira sp. CG24C]|nr:MAG: uroporphyrinogen-III synthase [Nitrospira sp. CG24C]TKB55164.1 MAG: uroporphyrinogen-III synthase [Nitrospira sp.]
MATAGFNGLTVASFESRMAVEITRLIERHRGKPLVTPALREIPLDDNSAALKFGVKLMTERVDLLILLTGVGTTALFDLLKTRYPWPSLMAALKQTALVARGPKPVAALKAFGLQPTLTVPEPNTWADLISTLDEYRPVKGLRIAVQEYGASNPDLLKALSQRGAEVFQVPIYRWALPENLRPLRQALDEIIAEKVAVLLITNAAQVDHVMQVLEKDGKVEPFRAALKKMAVASIGPTASERLRQHDWPIDLEPSHPKMGVLVKECSEQAARIFLSKRSE